MSNYRHPSMEEFMNKVIFTCQDCSNGKIITADKKSFIKCTLTDTKVDDNATCDKVDPIT